MSSSRPNMHDVARHAGVSQRTVSNVLSGYEHVTPRTRSLVMRAVAELDYRPNLAAKRLREGKTGTVALAVPNLSWPYFGEIAHLVQTEAHRHGYKLLVSENEGTRSHEAAVVRDLRSNLIDGLLLSPIELTADELDSLHTDSPLVLLGERISGTSFPHFSIDNVAAARDVTSHLLEQGARRFLLLGSTQTTATSSAGVLRLQGFEEQLRQFELGGEKTRWCHLRVSPWTEDRARTAVSQWLKSNEPPDAIFALNDLLAVGALRACYDLGLVVPNDLLLTGWDDTFVSRYAFPAITSVSPAKEQIARAGVGELISMIKGGASQSGDVTAPHHLEVRASSISIT